MAKGFKDDKGNFRPTGGNGGKNAPKDKSIVTIGTPIEKLEVPKPTVNDAFVSEVMLWLDNDEPMYKQMLAWAKNYKRKQERGVFDELLALKGMEILADQEIRMYKENVGEETFQDWLNGTRVDRDTKEELKKQLLERVLQAIEEGEV